MTAVIVCVTVLSVTQWSLLAPSAHAAGKFETMIDGRRVEMSFSFVADREGKRYSGNGTVHYQDGRYTFTSNGLRVYNDTKEMWTVDDNAREAVVQWGTSTNFLASPKDMITLFGFNASGAVIQPQYNADGTPKSYSVTLRDGTKLSVLIPSVKILPKGDTAGFSFNRHTLDSSYVITDLR